MTTHFSSEPLGARMKRYRRDAKLSVDDMATAFGVSKDTIRSWEQTRRQPRGFVDRLKRWAELCGVDYAELVTGVEPGSAPGAVRDVTLLPYSDIGPQGDFDHVHPSLEHAEYAATG